MKSEIWNIDIDMLVDSLDDPNTRERRDMRRTMRELVDDSISDLLDADMELFSFGDQPI